ncbi:MAG: hypothetical protein WA941_12900 [Nitrososphaeraceae archaeon]
MNLDSRYEEMLAYQRELWNIVAANKQKNPAVRAIDSLHSITNDIARIIDVILDLIYGS